MAEHSFEHDIREQTRHRENLNLQKKLLAVQEGLLSAQENRVAVQWSGTLRDLGRLIEEHYRLRNIQAKSLRNAVELVCAHFVDKNGKQFNTRSLCEIIRRTIEVQKQKPPSQKMRKVALVSSRRSKT